MNDRDILIRLTADEALVLFEFLSRTDSTLPPYVEDESERAVLWALQGKLEKILVEPFKPEYRDLLIAARQRIRGDDE